MYPIVLDKVMNKWNVNLLNTVPKKDMLNSKNLTCSNRIRRGEDIYPNDQIDKGEDEMHILTQRMKKE
jgi:hypothetical protein